MELTPDPGAAASDRSAAAHRAALRDAAQAAVRVWTRQLVTDLAAVHDAAGAGGSERLAVFVGTAHVTDTEGVSEPREELLSVLLAGSAGRAELASAGRARVWPELVEIWSQLREALSATFGEPVSDTLIVDVDRQVVAGFEPWHDPDLGPAPAFLAELDDPQAEDPFAALLADQTAEFLLVHDRLFDLMERHRVAVPSKPWRLGQSFDGPDGP